MAAKKQKRFSLSGLWRRGQIWAVAGDAVGETRKRAHSLLTDEQIATALMNVPLKGGTWDLRPALNGTQHAHASVGSWLKKHGWTELRRLVLLAEGAGAEINKSAVESLLSGEQEYMAGLDAMPHGGLTAAEMASLKEAEVIAYKQASMLTLIDLYLAVAQYHITGSQSHRSLCPLCWRLSATREGGLCSYHHTDRVLTRRDERGLDAAGGWRSLSQVRLADSDLRPLPAWDELLSDLDWQAPDAYQQLAQLAPMQLVRAQQQGIDRILLLPWRARRAVLERARRRLVLYQACRRLAQERLEATHTPGETLGQVIELTRNGLSQAEIARRLGVSRQRVSVLVREIREEGE